MLYHCFEMCLQPFDLILFCIIKYSRLTNSWAKLLFCVMSMDSVAVYRNVCTELKRTISDIEQMSNPNFLLPFVQTTNLKFNRKLIIATRTNMYTRIHVQTMRNSSQDDHNTILCSLWKWFQHTHTSSRFHILETVIV